MLLHKKKSSLSEILRCVFVFLFLSFLAVACHKNDTSSTQQFAPLWRNETGRWNKFVAFTSTGDVLWAANDRVETLAKEDGKTIKSIKYCNSGLPVGLIDDVTWVVACDSVLTQYSLISGQVIVQVNLGAPIKLVTMSPTLTEVVLASGAVHILATKDFSPLALRQFPTPPNATAFDPAQHKAFFMTEVPMIGVWDFANNSYSDSIMAGRLGSGFLAINSTASRLVAETDYFELTVFDLRTHRVITRLKADSWTTAGVFANDKTLVTAGSNGITFYDLDTGAQTILLQGIPQEALALSPDGTQLIAGDREGVITSFRRGDGHQKWF